MLPRGQAAAARRALPRSPLARLSASRCAWYCAAAVPRTTSRRATARRRENHRYVGSRPPAPGHARQPRFIPATPGYLPSYSFSTRQTRTIRHTRLDRVSYRYTLPDRVSCNRCPNRSGMTLLFGLKGTPTAQKTAFSFFLRPLRDSSGTKNGLFVHSAAPKGVDWPRGGDSTGTKKAFV